MASKKLPTGDKTVLDEAMERVFRGAGVEEHYFKWSPFDQWNAAGEVATGAFEATGANLETSHTNTSAISVTALLTNITTAGSESRTLAGPATEGQLKIIVMTSHGGDCTVAATNIGAGSGTLTFNGVGKNLILMSAGGKWQVLGGTATIA